MNPSRRAKIEAHAFARCFYPHKDNSSTRKYTTLFLFGLWAVITAGIAFGVAESTQVYFIMSMFVWLILGRMWDIEVGRLMPAADWTELPPDEEEKE